MVKVSNQSHELLIDSFKPMKIPYGHIFKETEFYSELPNKTKLILQKLFFLHIYIHLMVDEIERVEIQPEANEGTALADAHGAVGKTKLVRLHLAFIEFIIKSYVITESKCF